MPFLVLYLELTTWQGWWVWTIIICVHNHNYQKRRTSWIWDKDHHRVIKNRKPIVLSGDSKVLELTGKQYAYGNKCNLGYFVNSFVGQYVKYNVTLDAHISTSVILEMATIEIDVGTNDLSWIISLVISLIKAVLNVLFWYQNTYSIVNLCKVTEHLMHDCGKHVLLWMHNKKWHWEW